MFWMLYLFSSSLSTSFSASSSCRETMRCSYLMLLQSCSILRFYFLSIRIYFSLSSMLLTRQEQGWLALSSSDRATLSSSLTCSSYCSLFLRIYRVSSWSFCFACNLWARPRACWMRRLLDEGAVFNVLAKMELSLGFNLPKEMMASSTYFYMISQLASCSLRTATWAFSELISSLLLASALQYYPFKQLSFSRSIQFSSLWAFRLPRVYWQMLLILSSSSDLILRLSRASDRSESNFLWKDLVSIIICSFSLVFSLSSLSMLSAFSSFQSRASLKNLICFSQISTRLFLAISSS